MSLLTSWKLLEVHKEWNEKCKSVFHLPKFWFYANNRPMYECALCGIHLNARDRLDRLQINKTDDKTNQRLRR